jgi:hypothetical protein
LRQLCDEHRKTCPEEAQSDTRGNVTATADENEALHGQDYPIEKVVPQACGKVREPAGGAGLAMGYEVKCVKAMELPMT